MAMSGSTAPGEIRSEINVTPLVDVCLVLLIIFMVVTPLLQKGVDVLLPRTPNPAKKPEGSNQVQIALKVDKTMWYKNQMLPADVLRTRLKELYARAPGKEIILKADARLTFGDVKEMMELIKGCGFENIGLIAEKRRQ